MNPPGELPKGAVYLGTGGTFKLPEGKDHFQGFVWSRGQWHHGFYSGQLDGAHYAARADSEIAHLNGLTPKPNPLVDALREALAELVCEVEGLMSESKGVADFEPTGENATWDELIDTDRLASLHTARAVLERAENEPNPPTPCPKSST